MNLLKAYFCYNHLLNSVESELRDQCTPSKVLVGLLPSIPFTPFWLFLYLNNIVPCIHPGRVHTHGQLVPWKGGAPSTGQRTTTTAAGTNTKEVRAFSRMEEAHEITMKIRGPTMVVVVTTFISLLNAELFHLQGG